MSEETTTPEVGSGANLTVAESVEGFEALLTTEEDSKEQPEAVEEEVVENNNEEEAEAEETEEVEEVEEVEAEEVEDSQEEEETEEDTPQTYTVKAAGQDKEVTIDELVTNYQLGADYTKKTQEIADQRKEIETESHAIIEARQVRDLYSQRLQSLEVILSQDENPSDMAALKENDPIGYAVKVAEMTERREQLQQVRNEQESINAQQRQANALEQQKLVGLEAAKLNKVLPEFSDQAKGEQLRNEIRNYGKSIGFKDEELANVYDSRHVVTLHKAMMYDKLQKSKPGVNKKVAKAPKMVKSGTKTTKNSNSVMKQQSQKLKGSGKVRDAAKLFENFI
jgi:hypothetical protein